MSSTAAVTTAAESTMAESTAAVAKSTATDAMLDAIRISAMDAAVVAARAVRTGIAVCAAVAATTYAASQEGEPSHSEDDVERPLPLAILQRELARWRDGLFVHQFVSVHKLCAFLVHFIWQCASFSNCRFSAGDMFSHIAQMV
jgi:hypothetical protein